MLNGKLKINDDKNEFLIIGPSQQLGKVFQILSLCAGLVVIIPKSALKFARAHTKVGFPTEYLLEVEKALRITIHGLDVKKFVNTEWKLNLELSSISFTI